MTMSSQPGLTGPALLAISSPKTTEPRGVTNWGTVLPNALVRLHRVNDILLLEVHAWTGYIDQFTHVSEAGTRMDDLAVSVAAVLVSEACNVGFRPVLKPGVPALSRGRLSHVDENYVRVETLRAANARLIEAQAKVPFAKALGGGLVAGVDGLRFVVPVATLNPAPNPHYFGMRRGVTWLNAVNDQFSGIGAVVVPGTVRDSLYVLDLLLNLEGGRSPTRPPCA
jgi:hypothetical protein